MEDQLCVYKSGEILYMDWSIYYLWVKMHSDAEVAMCEHAIEYYINFLLKPFYK